MVWLNRVASWLKWYITVSPLAAESRLKFLLLKLRLIFVQKSWVAESRRASIHPSDFSIRSAQRVYAIVEF